MAMGTSQRSTIRYRNELTPLSQSLIHSYFLGPQTSLRFYLRSCTYAMLYCFITIVRGAPVLFM